MKAKPGETKSNIKGQGSSSDPVVDAADQVDGLKSAQKQNPRAVENTDKSDQNLRDALKERTRE